MNFSSASNFDDSLIILYSNVDNGVLNKKDELGIRISEIKPNIIGLTEIKPKHQFFDAGEVEFEIAGYHPFFNDK